MVFIYRRGGALCKLFFVLIFPTSEREKSLSGWIKNCVVKTATECAIKQMRLSASGNNFSPSEKFAARS